MAFNINGITPHSSPHKEQKEEHPVPSYLSSVMMSPQQQRVWSPPVNIRVRTPETFRHDSTAYPSPSLCLKRKCVSESNLSNKCYIREIAHGMDKMIIKMKSPPPSVGDSFAGVQHFDGNSENTMDCFPHSFQSNQSSPPLASPLASPSDSSSSWPETISPRNSFDATRGQCNKTLWGLPERIEDVEDENGFVMGMDYCAVDEGPSPPRINADVLPKRIIQLRKEMLGADIQPGMFVRDANVFGNKQQFSGLARYHAN